MKIVVRYVFADAAGVLGLENFLRNLSYNLLPVVGTLFRLAFALKTVLLAVDTRGSVKERNKEELAHFRATVHSGVSLFEAIHF